MRIAEIIGKVTLSRAHPSVPKGRLLIAMPFSLKALQAQGRPDGEEVVVYDELGAGLGQRVAISEGAEASMPFRPEKKILDAYCSCLLDEINI